MTQTQSSRRRAHRAGCAGFALLLTIGGCTTLPWQMTPADRALQTPPQQQPALASANPPVKRATGKASDGKAQPDAMSGALSADYYRVKPGDTLYRIASSHGQRSEDIVKWNNLTDAQHIVIGSVLRVTPPPDPARSAESQAHAKTSATRNADNVGGKNDKPDDKAPHAAKDSTIADTARTRFSWPARGALSAVYGQGKSKGMVISAKAGDPVRAAAAGRVVFAGDGGKPYGKLIVIKNDDALVTAYGHNRTLLVKEGTTVKRGELIAEMAQTEHGDGSMQFEVRKDGRPVDPAPYLPRVGS